MKVAVTDACIFIDLMELKIISPFFHLDLEIHTTLEVFYELYPEQQEILKAYETVNKLNVHHLSAENLEEIQAFAFPKALSQQDRSVIFIASQLKAMVLSSDKPVRNFAKKMAIETHGMFWILDQLVNQQQLNKEQAISKLRQLMHSNLIYQNNVQLWKEANKRIKLWGGSIE